MKKSSKKKKIESFGRSGLEGRINEQLKSIKIKYSYEEEQIQYVRPSTVHIYTPDFVIYTSQGRKIYIESKGLWDYEDRYKHLLIRQQYPDLDIRFVFTRSSQRIRKGSKTTYADICNGKGSGPFKGVIWQYADQSIPEEWIS